MNLIIIDPNVGNVVLSDLEKCEGKARVNKEKIVFFYEWKIISKLTGYAIEKENKIKGKIMITFDEADSELK